MDWGPEGFQLWLGFPNRGIILMNFVKSVPEYIERLVMLGSDRVCISPLKSHEELATAPHCIWETYKVPYDYISANCPIRYLGVDPKCNRVLVVAGSRGFCYYIFKSAKWRLFRKESQVFVSLEFFEFSTVLILGKIVVFNRRHNRV